jgi:hypothetical protein
MLNGQGFGLRVAMTKMSAACKEKLCLRRNSDGSQKRPEL